MAFLPGASGRAAAWRPVAERLGGRRPAILLDYPGLGDAAEDPSIRSLSDLGRWARSVLPNRFDLVTLSAGSAVGLRIALDAPERVRKLVLVSAAAGIDVAPHGGVDFRPAFVARRPEAPRWFVDDREDLTERLSALTVPTLLVFGEQDLVAPPALGRFLAERLPDAKLEIVERATHDLEAEQPDWVAAAIEAHLRA